MLMEGCLSLDRIPRSYFSICDWYESLCAGSSIAPVPAAVCVAA